MKIIILDVNDGGLSQDIRFILIQTSEGCMEIMRIFTLTPLGKKDQSLKFHQKVKLIRMSFIYKKITSFVHSW